MAMVQLKTRVTFNLEYGPLPVCLPPACGDKCRTRDGKTIREIMGFPAYSSKHDYRPVFNLNIISRAKCKQIIDTFKQDKKIRTIKYDHICTDVVRDNDDVCTKQAIGGPLSIQEDHGR